MGTSPYVNNSLSISSLLSRFVGKNYFHGNVGSCPAYCPRVLLQGRSLKIHIEIKRELFTQRRERERTNAYPAIINKSLLLLTSWHIHSRVLLQGIKPIARRH